MWERGGPMNADTLQKAKELEREIDEEKRSINAIKGIRFYRTPFSFKVKTISRVMHFFYGAFEWEITLSDRDLDFLLCSKNKRLLNLEDELKALS